MSSIEPPVPAAETVPHCYRHPERETYISCQRCARPICPDCMTQASVGFQCPDCVRAGAAQTPQVRTSFGGRVTSGSAAVTLVLIALNVAAFIIANATGKLQGEFGRQLVLIPDGSIYLPPVDGVAQGAYWQLLSSTFLHFSFIHIAFNLYALWLFGSFLESQLGRWRYLSLYLLAGLAGSVCVYLLSDVRSYSLGASGSIFGLFGASLFVLLRQRRDVSQLLVLLGLNLAITFALPNISWQAHLGGLAAGLAVGAVFAYAPRSRRLPLHIAILVVLAVACVGLVALRTASLTA
ncbi:MAG: rhomboid family intramembrane serine protease [Nocardioidaceae bacterium]|nr:rhomboid family intramembrane serine protease [Nocardioidaceae bacterium]